ncbi:MAG: hypothetical protein G01um101438_259 [Parcubacteria group bacterium Gr01-1014_38]|nr:MAG: hypothetical protein G01um101438_259 [Parcubacteria group bacterium Gr01-1014_38]
MFISMRLAPATSASLALVGAGGARFLRRHGGLFVVLGLALAHRIAFFRWWKAFPGGDTYNFILIAQELLKGSYPVAEKRLPVYPALIALAHTVFDWEGAAIAVAMIASLVAIALLYFLGRTLGLSNVALVVGLAPFQAVAPFLFQSVRGYADTTFIALFLGALLAFLRTRTRRGAIGTGVLFALASLARFEGVFLLALFPLLALVYWKPRSLMKPALAAAVVCWLPFALLFTRVGRPLLPVEYFADAEATPFGVTTLADFSKNYAAIWTSVGVDRLWGEPPRILRDIATLEARAWPARLRSFFTDPKEFPSLLLLAGIVFLARRHLRRFLLILLPFLFLAVPIAWWGVRQRFLVMLYPVLFLVLAAGVQAAIQTVRQVSFRWPRASRAAPMVAGVLLLGLSLGPWTAHTAAEAREVQQKNLGTDYAYYQAIQAARALPGTIAFEHRSSIVLALFGEKDEGRAVFAETHLNTPSGQEQWQELQRWDVRYIVIRGTISEAFPVLVDPRFADQFLALGTFEYPQARKKEPSRATIYEVRDRF